jgi:hypothetical protein
LITGDHHRVGDGGLSVQVDGENLFGLRIVEAVEDGADELAGIGFSLNTNRVEQSLVCSRLDRGYQSHVLLLAGRDRHVNECGRNSA